MNNPLPPDFDCLVAIEVRDAWEKILDDKYTEAHEWQQKVNELNEQIETYKRQQEILDE